MKGLLDLLRNLGARRSAALGAIGVGAIGFFIYLMMRMSTPEMALLYSDVAPDDAAHIVTQLEQRNIPYELHDNGSQIFIPATQVPQIRMALAEAGLPRGGVVGYEIFDKPESLGTSNFVRDINRLRALEGELSRTITSIDGIKTARVHLVLPRRELFSREQQEPSASIALSLRGSTRLTPGQVSAIEHLVASAVPGLRTSRISIVDDRGTLLARGAGDGDDAAAAAATADERRRAFEDQLRRKIIAILEPIVGADHVRAEVTADMDFDRVSTSSEEYDPNSQVARSTQTVTENNNSNDSQGQQPVTVQSNIPGTPSPSNQQNERSSTNSARNEETTNYEISKTVKSLVREGGQIRRLSVAVMVDGSYPVDASGKHVYQPRTKAELDQLTSLVDSAIGYDQKRGDRVELINMRFANPDDLEQPAPTGLLFGLFSPSELYRIAQVLVLALVSVLLLLFVIRPLLSRLLEATKSIAATPLAQRALSDQSGGPAPALAPPTPGAAPQPTPEELESMIDIGQVEGRVRQSSIKKVGQIVEKHPEEAIAILRSWMVQES